VRCVAPAKVNLGLRVVGRRADGYHLIESLFAPLALADELEVESGPGSEIRLSVEGDAGGVPADASNLAWRAASAFLDAAGLRAGVSIRLLKRIPAAAGLGGGSSDAAAVLRALAALHPGVLEPAELDRLALGLGADVPFFLDPRPAWVSGIGERIDPLPALPSLALLLANPGAPLSTAAVYRGWDESEASLTPGGRAPSLFRLPVLLGEGGRLDRAALARLLANDLEPAATRLCPAIARLRELLGGMGARAVGMTGSGPTMVAVFDSEAEVRQAQRGLEGRGEARSWMTVTLPSGSEAGTGTGAGRGMEAMQGNGAKRGAGLQERNGA